MTSSLFSARISMCSIFGTMVILPFFVNSAIGSRSKTCLGLWSGQKSTNRSFAIVPMGAHSQPVGPSWHAQAPSNGGLLPRHQCLSALISKEILVFGHHKFLISFAHSCNGIDSLVSNHVQSGNLARSALTSLHLSSPSRSSLVTHYCVHYFLFAHGQTECWCRIRCSACFC